MDPLTPYLRKLSTEVHITSSSSSIFLFCLIDQFWSIGFFKLLVQYFLPFFSILIALFSSWYTLLFIVHYPFQWKIIISHKFYIRYSLTPTSSASVEIFLLNLCTDAFCVTLHVPWRWPLNCDFSCHHGPCNLNQSTCTHL